VLITLIKEKAQGKQNVLKFLGLFFEDFPVWPRVNRIE